MPDEIRKYAKKILKEIVLSKRNFLFRHLEQILTVLILFKHYIDYSKYFSNLREKLYETWKTIFKACAI